MKHSLLPVLALFLVSCTGDNAAGTYELDKEALRKTVDAAIEKLKQDPNIPVNDQAIAAARTALESMVFDLTLAPDGTLSGRMGAVLGQADIKGSWTASDSTVSLTFAEGGQSATRTGVYSGDRITFTEVKAGFELELVLKRKT